MTNVIASFCNLRAEFAARPDASSPETILGRALGILFQFRLWEAGRPIDLHYHTVSISDPDASVLTDYYYVWSQLGYAVLQTSYWMTAILLHGMIIQQLELLSRDQYPDPWDAHDYVSQMQRSITTILAFVDDICASVHYHLSLCKSSPGTDPSSDSDDMLLPSASAMMAILKPLYVAGDSRFCPLDTRAWIVEQLKVIGLKMGLKQALFLADVMVQRRDVTDSLLRERRKQYCASTGPSPIKLSEANGSGPHQELQTVVSLQ